MSKKKKEIRAFSLDPEILARLEQKANEEKRSRSQMLEMLLDEVLPKQKADKPNQQKAEG